MGCGATKEGSVVPQPSPHKSPGGDRPPPVASPRKNPPATPNPEPSKQQQVASPGVPDEPLSFNWPISGSDVKVFELRFSFTCTPELSKYTHEINNYSSFELSWGPDVDETGQETGFKRVTFSDYMRYCRMPKWEDAVIPKDMVSEFLITDEGCFQAATDCGHFVAQSFLAMRLSDEGKNLSFEDCARFGWDEEARKKMEALWNKFVQSWIGSPLEPREDHWGVECTRLQKTRDREAGLKAEREAQERASDPNVQIQWLASARRDQVEMITESHTMRPHQLSTFRRDEAAFRRAGSNTIDASINVIMTRWLFAWNDLPVNPQSSELFDAIYNGFQEEGKAAFDADSTRIKQLAATR